MSGAGGDHAATRPIDIVAALSLATDLALGQPMEHVWRSTLLAVGIAKEIGASDDEVGTTFWTSMLALSGCIADSYELSALFGDDIELRRGMYDAGTSSLAQLRYFVSCAGSDGGPVRRIRSAVRLLATGMRPVLASLHSHCAVTSEMATRLGLGSEAASSLQHTFTRWDGNGVPGKIAGEAIAPAARMLALADAAEVYCREVGTAEAAHALRAQAGSVLDPSLVATWCRIGAELWATVGDGTTTAWDLLVDAAPLDGRRTLMASELDRACEVLADYADLKSPRFTGHSRAVAVLAAAAGRRMGLSAKDVDMVRRAGLLHEIGRAGVPNTVWDKRGPLSPAELERARSHAYLTDRILRHVPGLAAVAELAAASHERLDGSGYPRRIAGAALPPAMRVLAAAETYQSMIEAGNGRPALSPQHAAAKLEQEVRSGRQDGNAVAAVLAEAGHRAPPVTTPAGMTSRELEVLRLVCAGRTSRQVATELGISVKTVNNHIERAYLKIGVGSRAAATLYLAQRGLV